MTGDRLEKRQVGQEAGRRGERYDWRQVGENKKGNR